MSRIVLVKGRSSSFLRLELLASLGRLLLLGLLAYGPWMAQLGFYRDDWYVLWAGAVLGPQAIITMFSIDRPTRRFVMRFATRSATHRHPVSRRRIRPA